MSNADVQAAFNVFDNNFEIGLGKARTLTDLANMKYAVQQDTSLSVDDKKQLLKDIVALEPLVGAAGQGGAWQNGVTQLVNDTAYKTGSMPSKVAEDAATGGRVDTTLPETYGPYTMANYGWAYVNGINNIPSVSDGARKTLSVLKQDPDMLNSLKQYVKSESQQSLFDSLSSALPNQGTPTATDDSSEVPLVNSNIKLTLGGAQSGSGNSASLDAWDVNNGLTNPGNIDEFLMMVLLASYEDNQSGLEMMAKNLQKTNEQKKALRSTLAGLYGQKSGDETTDAGVDAQIENVQGQLSSASDDAQMQQLQLQNATQNQQQLLTEISAFSKSLYDASMGILRKIGS